MKKRGFIHGPSIALIILFSVVSLWIFIKPIANKVRNQEHLEDKNLSLNASSEDYNFVDNYAKIHFIKTKGISNE